MSTKLIVRYNREELNARISSIIEVDNKDELTTHLKQIFLFKNDNRISGNITGESFTIWIHGNTVTGAFYPVMTAKVKSLREGLEIQIDSKMNVVGTIIAIGIFLLIGCGILTNIVIQKENELIHLIPRVCVGIVLLTLWMSLPVYIFIRTLKIVKRHLIKELIIKR